MKKVRIYKLLKMFLTLYPYSNISLTIQVEPINSLTKTNLLSATSNLRKLISVSCSQACSMNHLLPDRELSSYIICFCKIALMKLLIYFPALRRKIKKSIVYSLITLNALLICTKDILLSQELAK